MMCPPEGLCLPCKWLSNRDGDTVVVELRTGQQLIVRLLDCWCEELTTQAGRDAKHWIDSLLEENDDPLHVFLPLPRDRNHDGRIDITDLLHQASFDRVLGRLFIGTEDVSGMLVRHGHAVVEKG